MTFGALDLLSFVLSHPKMCEYHVCLYHLLLFIPLKGRLDLPVRDGDSRSLGLVPTLALTHCWASGCSVSKQPSFPMYRWSLWPDLTDIYKMFLGSWINGAPCIDSKGPVTALGGTKTSSSSLFQKGFSLCTFIFSSSPM